MKIFLKKYYILFVISIMVCQFPNERLYITIQMMDQIGVINSQTNELEDILEIEMQNYNNSMCMDITNEIECNISNDCEWMMGMCMENMNSSDINTPHYIIMDEILGYWFTTTIASGYVAQYSLVDNSFIDSYFVGDAPAILTIDTNQNRIYCSRMMPMNGMGNMMPSSESNIIQSLDYSPLGLSPSLISEYMINSPAPHGIAISDNGTNIFTASNTADWLYKINTVTGEIISENMDQTIGNPPDQTTQRLKPIQCLFNNDRLFVSCSAGPWYNPFTGETTIIPGRIQLWDTELMTLIDVIDIGEYSSPWHIRKSLVDNVIYVALAGDNLYDTAGIACIRYQDDELIMEWIVTGTEFDTPHGIDVSNDGEKIYMSDRGNGNIYLFNPDGEIINTTFIGSMSMLGGISITQELAPELGDINYDEIINVVDIIMLVNTIINNIMLSPYQEYASNMNNDDVINVTDIISIVNLIINN